MTKSEYLGMTLNERLFAAGLLSDFDAATENGDVEKLGQLLGQVDADPSLAITLLGEGYQCWFCGKGLDRDNSDALRIVIGNLWAKNTDSSAQEIYSHFICAEKHMAGTKMTLERDIFLPDEGED